MGSDSEEVGSRTARRERELDAPDRDGDAGSKLQEYEPDGAAGRPCQFGPGKPDPAHRAHQDICERRQPEPQLIGAHGRCRRAVGEEIALVFLQPRSTAEATTAKRTTSASTRRTRSSASGLSPTPRRMTARRSTTFLMTPTRPRRCGPTAPTARQRSKQNCGVGA